MLVEVLVPLIVVILKHNIEYSTEPDPLKKDMLYFVHSSFKVPWVLL